MSRINETVKKAVDDIDLDARLDDLVDVAERTWRGVVDRAAGYAQDHHDELRQRLDHLGEAVQQRTDDHHSERVEQLRGHLADGLERLARRGGDGPAA